MDLAKIRKKQKEEKERSRRIPEEPSASPIEPAEESMPVPITDDSSVSAVGKKPDGSLGVSDESEAIGGLSAETTSGDAAEPVQIAEFLIFNVAEEDFAFRVSDVHEISKPHGITRVPGVDPSILGITALRGKVIPVVDLKKRLLISSGYGDRPKNSKVLILKGPRGPIGALVDRGIDVIRIAEGDIIPPPSHLSEEEMKFIEGIAPYNDRFYSIIRTEGVLDLDLGLVSGLLERRNNERKA